MATQAVSPRNDVRQHIASMNKRKRAPGITDELRESLPPAFIFNVYNLEHRVQVSNFGTFRIPACPPGQRFAGPVCYGGKPYIEGFLPAEYDMGTGNGAMGVVWEEGKNVAKDVLGIGNGPGQPGLLQNDRTYWGCFISKTATRENPVPSEEEIAEARRKLTGHLTLWFNDGQRLAKLGQLQNIGPNHRDAAEFLNQKVDWSAKATPMEICPGCQEPVKPNTVRHSCGAVLDADRALETGMVEQSQYDAIMRAKARREKAEAAPAAENVAAAPVTQPKPVANQPIYRKQ